MSKYKASDKVVVDITGVSKYGESYEVSHKSMWSTGSVDRVAKPLSEYTEQARAEGEQVAWELARKIVKQSYGYESWEEKEIFGTDYFTEIFQNTYSEAAAKVEAWEKAKEEIKVGDIVKIHEGNDNDLCVLCMSTDKKYYNAVDGYGAVYYMLTKEMITKTGRHIDIDSLLKQIGEE